MSGIGVGAFRKILIVNNLRTKYFKTMTCRKLNHARSYRPIATGKDCLINKAGKGLNLVSDLPFSGSFDCVTHDRTVLHFAQDDDSFLIRTLDSGH